MGGSKGKGKYGTAISGGGVLDKSTIDRLMLKFRPIAPKPAGNGTSTGEATTECNDNKYKRKKRKYVRVRKNNRPRRKKKTPSSPDGGEMIRDDQDKSVVTLQLLPERSDGEDSLTWRSNVVVESRVTVECVTDTCAVDGEGLGLTDGDRLRALETDTCPAFVSDGFDTVRWVNDAYKKMVSAEENSDGGVHGLWKKEFRVCLVMKERFPCKYLCPALGCRVRVDYTWRGRRLSRTVPCDMWRMECGWFAWRLDVKSALSLGI